MGEEQQGNPKNDKIPMKTFLVEVRVKGYTESDVFERLDCDENPVDSYIEDTIKEVDEVD